MALGRSDGLLYEIGDGFSALDAESKRDRLDGYAVESGLGVTVKSGLTVTVASGTATVGSSSGSVDTATLGSNTDITLDSANSSDPRKDTIYLDTGGTVQKETGTAEPYAPSGNTLFETFEPEPPFPSTEGVILAEVVVPAGASSINTSDHVRDRRAPAQMVADSLTAQSVDTDDLDIGGTDLFATSDFVSFKTFPQQRGDWSTTSTSYTSDHAYMIIRLQWDKLPAAVDSVQTFGQLDGSSEPTDLRLRNIDDGENIFEITNKASVTKFERVDTYTPTTTNSLIAIRPEIRADDGNNSATLNQLVVSPGVQL